MRTVPETLPSGRCPGHRICQNSPWKGERWPEFSRCPPGLSTITALEIY